MDKQSRDEGRDVKKEQEKKVSDDISRAKEALREKHDIFTEMNKALNFQIRLPERTSCQSKINEMYDLIRYYNPMAREVDSWAPVWLDEGRGKFDNEMKELDDLLAILPSALEEKEKSRLSSMDTALRKLLENCLEDTSLRKEVNVWRSENFEALQDFISLVKERFLHLAGSTFGTLNDRNLKMDTYFMQKSFEEQIHYFDREQDSMPIVFLDILIHTELLIIKIHNPFSSRTVDVAITDRLEEIDPGLKVAYLQEMKVLYCSDESLFMGVDSNTVNRHLDIIRGHIKDLIWQIERKTNLDIWWADCKLGTVWVTSGR